MTKKILLKMNVIVILTTIVLPQLLLPQVLSAASVAVCPEGTTPVYFPAQDPVSGVEVAGTEIQYCKQSNGTQIDPTIKDVPTGSISCASWRDYLSGNAGTCIGRAFGALLGGFFMGTAVHILSIVGNLFDWMIKNTIVVFADQIYSPIKDGVERVWTVFRDVANILIIGLFTYIAISIILGVGEFGTKRMVGRVLIIAVLINFSLLFTKIIIDTSNFTAKTFYDASGFQVASSGASAPSQSGVLFNTPGVAGTFIDLMGVEGVFFGKRSAFDTIRELGDKLDNGFLAFFHGVFAGLVLLAVALVLIYGIFLMLARAVLMLFLIMVSSLAFATYLIPKFSDGDYGWNKWWEALIKNAVFAPVFMMFLWATLTIAQTLKSQGGVLGNLVKGSSTTSDIGALFNYLIILGLLFASIKISSSFSTAAANKIAGITAGATLGLGGLATRYTVGWSASRLGRADILSKVPGGQVLQRGLMNVAKSSGDFRSIPGVASGAKYFGLDVGKADGKGGYLHSVEEREENIVKKQVELAKFLGSETRSDRRKQAGINKQVEDEKANLKTLEKQREELARSAASQPPKQTPATQQQAGSSLPLTPDGAAAAVQQGVQQGVQQAMQNVSHPTTQPTTPTPTPTSASGAVLGQQAQETAKINQAKQTAQQQAHSETTAAVKDNPTLAEVEKKIEESRKRLEALAKNTAKKDEKPKWKPKTAADLRKERFLNDIAHKQYLSFPMSWGKDGVAHHIAEEVKKKLGETKLEKELAKMLEQSKKAGEESHSAAAHAEDATKHAEGAAKASDKATKQATHHDGDHHH